MLNGCISQTDYFIVTIIVPFRVHTLQFSVIFRHRPQNFAHTSAAWKFGFMSLRRTGVSFYMYDVEVSMYVRCRSMRRNLATINAVRE